MTPAVKFIFMTCVCPFFKKKPFAFFPAFCKISGALLSLLRDTDLAIFSPLLSVGEKFYHLSTKGYEFYVLKTVSIHLLLFLFTVRAKSLCFTKLFVLPTSLTLKFKSSWLNLEFVLWILFTMHWKTPAALPPLISVHPYVLGEVTQLVLLSLFVQGR